MAEIPFWVHDRPKWVSGISKSTTCQDVLQSLVLAERKSKTTPTTAPPSSSEGGSARHHQLKAQSKENNSSRTTSSSSNSKDQNHQELTAKEVSKGLALVEQWRGVERPLSNSSKILKLWLAWGEERSQVRFVVKRISGVTSDRNKSQQVTTSSQQQQSQVTNPSSSHHRHNQQQQSSSKSSNSSRPRRRNSRASLNSEHHRHHTKKNSDTMHPNALSKMSKSSTDLERLMRIILTQGETIHWQLKKLQERECQIENIEQEVHNSRTKTAGKDYLLNAYLSQDHINKQQQQSAVLPATTTVLPDPKDIKATAEGIQDILEALSAVFKLNEQITEAEEQVSELNQQLSVTSQSQQQQQHQQKSASANQNPLEIKALQSELKDLRTTNDAAGQEIDYNRHLISSMRLAYDERKALMAKLEQDVDSIDLETAKLQQELQALQTKRKEQTFELLNKIHTSHDPNDDDIGDVTEDDDEEEEEPIIFSGGFLSDHSEVPLAGAPPGMNLTCGSQVQVVGCGTAKNITNGVVVPNSSNNISYADHLSTTTTASTTTNGHYDNILTNEQLYNEGPHHQEPSALYDELQRRLRIKTTCLEDFRLQSPDINTRIKATGSPGSNSSSGNSSGSAASYEKSVRFSDREMILSTPELPDLPNDQINNISSCNSSSSNSKAKSILKAGEVAAMAMASSMAQNSNGAIINGHGDNTDSNSDTGLSSLHSSSDEGTYVLDTLV